MIIEDIAVVLDLKKIQENTLLIKCFSKNHGIMNGFYNYSKINNSNYKQVDCKQNKYKQTSNINAISNIKRTNKYIPSTAHIVRIKFVKKNEDKSGKYYTMELANNKHMSLLMDINKIMFLNSAISILSDILHELDSHILLWESLCNFMQKLNIVDNIWLNIKNYILFEMEILKYSGFGLNLKNCVVTGTVNNLMYVSPKSGCAVSAEIGDKYKDKLLALPSFLHIEDVIPSSIVESHNGLKMTEFFIKKYMIKQLPFARTMLYNKISTLKSRYV